MDTQDDQDQQNDQTPPRRWVPAETDEFVWFLAIPVLGTLGVVFERGSLTEIGLTLLSGLVLGSVIGLRYVWSRRRPLEHEQSHIRLTILVSVVMWTAFLIGCVLFGWVKRGIDRQFGENVVFLITVGQLFMVALGAVWGAGIRALDWYPLRRTRASVIRLVALYLIALVLLSALSILMMDALKWQQFLGMTAALLAWLAIARLWRG